MKAIKHNEKQKRPTWIMIAAIVLIIALIIGGGTGYYFWSKQKDEKAAQETVLSYLQALEEQDYSTISKLASEESLKKIGYTKDKVKKRYEAIYGGIGVSDLTTSDMKVAFNKDKKEYDISYTVEMKTSLGKLDKQSFTTSMNKDEGDYKINWDTQLIFPELEPKDKISLTSTVGKRGDILSSDGSALATEGKVWDAGIHPVALGEGTEKDEKLKVISETI
ncbi:MAG: NTF2-like N-terminal transpeptidase domain-containing protein [Carnobacterium sp.]